MNIRSSMPLIAAVACLAISLVICGCHGTPNSQALGGEGPDEGTAQYPWTQKGTNAGQEIVGPDGSTLVWVPKVYTGNDMNGHYIYGMWIGKHEVTNARFTTFLNNQGADYTVKLIDLDSPNCKITKNNGTYTCSQEYR